MARCRCSTLCSCAIEAGANVTVTGNGSQGSPYIVSSTGGSGGGFTRTTAAYTTAFLANDAEEVGLITLAPGYRIYKLQVNVPCRFRLYVSAGHRFTDLARPIGIDPPDNSGLMLEYVTTAFGLYVLSPLADGFVETGWDAALAIDNKAGFSTTITATLTYVRTE